MLESRLPSEMRGKESIHGTEGLAENTTMASFAVSFARTLKGSVLKKDLWGLRTCQSETQGGGRNRF